MANNTQKSNLPTPPKPPAPKPEMLGSGAATNAAKKITPDAVRNRIRDAENAALGLKKGGKVNKGKKCK